MRIQFYISTVIWKPFNQTNSIYSLQSTNEKSIWMTEAEKQQQITKGIESPNQF